MPHGMDGNGTGLWQYGGVVTGESEELLECGGSFS